MSDREYACSTETITQIFPKAWRHRFLTPPSLQPSLSFLSSLSRPVITMTFVLMLDTSKPPHPVFIITSVAGRPPQLCKNYVEGMNWITRRCEGVENRTGSSRRVCDAVCRTRSSLHRWWNSRKPRGGRDIPSIMYTIYRHRRATVNRVSCFKFSTLLEPVGRPNDGLMYRTYMRRVDY